MDYKMAMTKAKAIVEKTKGFEYLLTLNIAEAIIDANHAGVMEGIDKLSKNLEKVNA